MVMLPRNVIMTVCVTSHFTCSRVHVMPCGMVTHSLVIYKYIQVCVTGPGT